MKSIDKNIRKRGDYMKCRWCGEEWAPINKRIRLTCPHCLKKSISLEESINDIEKGLICLVDTFGPDVYDDKQNVLEFIETYFPDKKRERNFVNIAYSVGAVKMILSARSMPDDREKSIIENAINQMWMNMALMRDGHHLLLERLLEVWGIIEEQRVTF